MQPAYVAAMISAGGAIVAGLINASTARSRKPSPPQPINVNLNVHQGSQYHWEPIDRDRSAEADVPTSRRPRWAIIFFALVVVTMAFVARGINNGNGDSAMNAVASKTPTPARPKPVSTTTKSRTNAQLVQDINDFLKTYDSAAHTNGGLGNTATVRTYFYFPMQWYGTKYEYKTPEAFARVKRDAASKHGSPSPCHYAAGKVADIQQAGDPIVVKANIQWRNDDGASGTTVDVYTLRYSKPAGILGIQKVTEPAHQRRCEEQ